VLVNIRTTTKHNSISQRRSTTIKTGYSLAWGFAQMAFQACPKMPLLPWRERCLQWWCGKN